MRFTTVIVAAALAAACNKQPPPAAPSAPLAPAVTPAPGAPAQVNVIRGKVAEKIDASQYSYLRISAAQGDLWAAVPKTAKAVGDTVGVAGPVWMENFKSTTLNRTWDRIAFGTLEGETPAAPQGAEAAPAAPAAAGPGMFAAAAAGKSEKPPAGMTAGPAAAADAAPIKVAKATGPQGRTIAELFAGRAQLKDKPVSVRGKVVKATNGVLGKNWLHLRDGTGAGGADDLTVASTDTAKLGDTVLVSGVVHLDRDLGSGYRYDVIVEDAKVKTE